MLLFLIFIFGFLHILFTFNPISRLLDTVPFHLKKETKKKNPCSFVYLNEHQYFKDNISRHVRIDFLLFYSILFHSIYFFLL